MSSDAANICLYILACVFPPAAVGAVTGCSCHLILNIFLSILWFPGVIHACILIAREARKERQLEQAMYPPPPQQGMQLDPGYGGQYAQQKV